MKKNYDFVVYAGYYENDIRAYGIKIDLQKTLDLRNAFYEDCCKPLSKTSEKCSIYASKPAFKIENNQPRAFIYKETNLAETINIASDSEKLDNIAPFEIRAVMRETKSFEPNILAENITFKNRQSGFDGLRLSDEIAQQKMAFNYKGMMLSKYASQAMYDTMWLAGIFNYQPKTIGERDLQNKFITSLRFVQIDDPRYNFINDLNKIIDTNRFDFFTGYALTCAKRDKDKVGHIKNIMCGYKEDSIKNLDGNKVSEVREFAYSCARSTYPVALNAKQPEAEEQAELSIEQVHKVC